MACLIDDERARYVYQQPPFLVDTVGGAQYRTFAVLPGGDDVSFANGGMTHIDKMPSVLGELGVRSDRAMRSNSGRTFPLAELLVDSLARCRADRELPWTVEMCCRYLVDGARWLNKDREVVSADILIRRLFDSPLQEGQVCLGGHRIRALATVAGRCSVTARFCSSQTTHDVSAELRRISGCLEKTQLASGAWDGFWAVPLGATGIGATETDTRMLHRLVATGHLLESATLLPDALRPNRESLARGCQYLRQELRTPTDFYFSQNLPPTTHAVIALLQMAAL